MRRVLAGIVAATTLLAACSSGGEPDDDTSTTTSTPATTDGASADGGILRIGLLRPESLDPVDLSPAIADELVLADLLYDGLTRTDEEGVAVPHLASFEADDELRRWTFRLDPARTFADGTPITGSDVKRSLERIAERGSTSPAALRLERIIGYADHVADRADGMAGITVPDPATVVIETVEPFAGLPDLLTSPMYGVVAGDPGPLGQPPPPSSPFHASSPEDDVLLLEATDDSGLRLDGVEIRFFDRPEEAYAAFADGSLDWAPVPAAEVEEAEADHGDAGLAPFHGTLYLGFNVATPPLDQLLLRQAVARAIDRDAAVEAVYGATALPLHQVVPPQMPGAADDPCTGVCDHDPAAARAAVEQVAEAGEVAGLVLDVEDGERLLALATLLQGQLGGVGLDVEVNSLPFDEYEALVAAGDQRMFLFGWIGIGSTAVTTVPPLFRSDSLDNVTGFSDPAVDFTLGVVRSAGDPAARFQSLAEVERLVLEQVPVVPLLQFRTLTVVAPRVRDLDIGLDGTFDVGRVWLAED